MAITIKEIHVKTTVVQRNRQPQLPPQEWVEQLKEDIVRELTAQPTSRQTKRER